MSAIIGNLLSTALIFLYINVGLVNGQDHVSELINQIGREYMEAVAPCRIIRNAYYNYEDEMKNFRKIQNQCKSIPRMQGFHGACEFLMHSVIANKSTFIKRVYYAMRHAVGVTPFGQLTSMRVVDGLVANAESSHKKKLAPAEAVCQHWAIVVDLCRGDNDNYRFGIYEVGGIGYSEEEMEKVFAACEALGIRSTRSLPSSKASSSGQPGGQ